MINGKESREPRAIDHGNERYVEIEKECLDYL
jgi:hypothetical protein